MNAYIIQNNIVFRAEGAILFQNIYRLIDHTVRHFSNHPDDKFWLERIISLIFNALSRVEIAHISPQKSHVLINSLKSSSVFNPFIILNSSSTMRAVFLPSFVNWRCFFRNFCAHFRIFRRFLFVSTIFFMQFFHLQKLSFNNSPLLFILL